MAIDKKHIKQLVLKSMQRRIKAKAILRRKSVKSNRTK